MRPKCYNGRIAQHPACLDLLLRKRYSKLQIKRSTDKEKEWRTLKYEDECLNRSFRGCRRICNQL